MSLLLFLIFGLVVGIIARMIAPGRHQMGLATTTLLGVAGSLMGGLVASLFWGHAVMQVHRAGLIGSVVGALFVLAVGRSFTGPPRTA